MSERRHNGEIAASLVVLNVKRRKVAQSIIKENIMAAGVWYRVDGFTIAGPYSRCELCCGWGQIERKYSIKAVCGYCSGNHQTSDQKYNVVGCTANQGSHCGHNLEKGPNCNGNLIVFCGRCAIKS